MDDLKNQLQSNFKGELATDQVTREKYKHDASIFEMTPSMVAFPKDVEDIKALVNFTRDHKKDNPALSLTPRSGGTCMSGGTLTESISVNMEHLNHIGEIENGTGVVEPGTYYRDFEKSTLEKGVIFPSYTSSKLICTVGGMVANNAGGEKSLNYGKTEKWVEELHMVLSDGNEYAFGKITAEQLEDKKKQENFEGELYRKMHELLEKNKDLIQSHRPKVSKNSAGYTIWDMWDGKTFDMSQVFIGAQGTLGINTKIKFKLVPVKKEHDLLMIYMKDFQHIPEIVKIVLSYKPESFESFDDYTLNLALKYVADFSPILHLPKLATIVKFLPEFWMKFSEGTPKFALIVDFESDSKEENMISLKSLQKELLPFNNIHTKIVTDDTEEMKDWAIRRESFNLLKNKLTTLKACPFIDDTCVSPEVLPEFLPKLYKILDEEKLLYSIAGHIGNGNFHIFPLLDLREEAEREKVFKVGERVFNLVWEYGGSTNGEHNDGLVRAPYLEKQFGSEIYNIFKEIKQIFDPQGIFNPRKKLDVTNDYIKPYLIKTIGTPAFQDYGAKK